MTASELASSSPASRGPYANMEMVRSEGGTGGKRVLSDSLDDATGTTMGSDRGVFAERTAPASAFGRYKLEQRIGAGGMGVVYRAYDPMLERPVALKIVRSQHGGEEGQRRLFREAQVLAQVRHPNVVAVHDVGALGEDVFVAMEMVDGTPLSKWQKERDSGDILRAYLQAGRGLAAAHARGLVHRDVKPDNILVGNDGRVTVIDFGLAAAVADGDGDDAAPRGSQPSAPVSDESPDTNGAPGADGSVEYSSHSSLRTPLTEVGRVMGTPRYMSPEQHAGGQRVDALSDQYSFALALYEALAKTWPFVTGKTAHGKADALRTAKLLGVFAPPVRAMSTHLRKTLQRALAADPSDRFPSMATLLEQLERDPARARRRRLAVAAVVVSLAFGAWSAVAARNGGAVTLCQGATDELAQTWNPQRRTAVKRAFLASGVSYAPDTFERVATALDAYGEQWVNMRTQACEATHVQGVQSDKILDLRMACLDRKRHSLHALVGLFTDKPDRQVIDKAVEASLALGGLAFCADTKALEQEVEPPEKPEDRQTLTRLRGRLEEVNQLNAVGKYKEAEARLKALAPQVETLGFPPLQAELAYHHALTLRFRGKYAEAEPRLKEAVQLALQWRMMELLARADVEATFLFGYPLHRHAEGLVYSLHAQAATRGRGDELEAGALNSLAVLYYAQGKYDEAEKLDRRALSILEQTLGPTHPEVARSLHNLADLYRDQGEHRKAEEFYKRALAIREQALGPSHPEVAQSLNNLAGNYRALARYAESEEFQKRALVIFEKAHGPDHPHVGKALSNLALSYRYLGDLGKAEDLLKRALRIKEETLGVDHPDVGVSYTNLADVYSDQGKSDEAEADYKRALALFEKAYGPEHPYTSYPLVGLASIYERERRFRKAALLLERASTIRDKGKVAPAARAQASFGLARVLWALGNNRARARALAQETLALYQSAGPGADKERRELEQWIAAHP